MSLYRTGQVKTVYPGILKRKTPPLIKVIGTKIKSNAENVSQKITTDYYFPPLHINKITEDLEEG